MNKNIHIIVQARLESSRLHEKVLKTIHNKTILRILLDRLKKSKFKDEIIVAIPNNKRNLPLKKILLGINFIKIFEGSLDNVLSRYYHAADKYGSDIIIRITADCPLIDSDLLDSMISKFLKSDLDYLSNTIEPTFPDGFDIEIFNFKTLEHAFRYARKSTDKEHVTPYIKRNKKKFKIQNFKNSIDLSNLRLTIDEKTDYEFIKKLTSLMKNKFFFGLKEIIKLYKSRPNLFKFNNYIKRDEGFSLNKGQKIWKRATNVIANGNMLLSKNPSRFFNLDLWPVYFEKTKGCKVWDLDKKRYYDFSLMGVGTNILGYNNSLVDNAVKKTVSNGNLSTLNCYEEVYLAEKLIEMHKWAHMVHFARSGGEANAIAIRIARAAINKNKIAVCGYHGWHDWYLSANLNKKNNLDTHLFPDLKFRGVPNNLKNTIYTFNYNDIETLTEIIKKDKEIGIIKMEVQRDHPPKNNFLQKVRKLADENNIILIFDECTSGFRENFGGLHLKYKVIPDIAMFGKALGNGYAITAVIGKKEFMKFAQQTFISSTFWTERIGPTAGIATLSQMEKVKSWEIISKTGKRLKTNIKKIATRNKLNIEFTGLDALINFKFNHSNHNIFTKFITNEMLKRKFLAKNSIYVSVSHTHELIEQYLNNLDEVFYQLGSFDIDKIKAIIDKK